MDQNQTPDPDKKELADETIEKLKSDYVLVTPKRIKPWQVLLLVGAVVGVVAGFLLVANHRGKVEKGKATTISQGISIELDLPDYYPEFLRHPQKYFSGRTIRIIAPAAATQNTLLLTNNVTGASQLQPLTTSEEGAELNSQTHVYTSVIATSTPTGNYTLSLTIGGQVQNIPLHIEGLSVAELTQDMPSTATDATLLSLVIPFRTKICDFCSWEMVFGGNPSNSSELAQAGNNRGNANGASINRSRDGGRTWNSAVIDSISTYPQPMSFRGDTKMILTSAGSILFSAMAQDLSSNGTYLGGVLYQGGFSGNFQASIFQNVPPNLPPGGVSLFVDYPKLALDEASLSPNKSSIYISGNTVWFEATQESGYGLYVSRDNGATFSKGKLDFYNTGAASAIMSMTVGDDATLYAGHLDTNGNGVFFPSLVRFASTTPPIFSTSTISGSTTLWPPRISTKSTRAWSAYHGPEIVIDTNPSSPHHGRLYAVWAQEEKAIADPNFEYPYYGYNFDVFVSYSDDNGQTWSPRVRVNDDIGAGDQFFPSVRISSNGLLNIAWVDHRNYQNFPAFDIYYAKSGDGVIFSKNLRVNDKVIANNISGGRTIGDYLDMVAAYPGKVFVAYPCGQNLLAGPTAACLAQINSNLVR